MRGSLSILELYAGIGGLAAAVQGRAEVLVAVDQNRKALAVYAANFPHRTLPQTVESLPDRIWAAANLWGLSPPCQPDTRRGRGRDLADPRAASLRTVLRRIEEHAPRYVALENVPPFEHSQARAALREVFTRTGYTVRECLLCPTELGWPNRRRRYYLVAARGEALLWPPRRRDGARGPKFAVSEILDGRPDNDLWVAPELLARYAGAIEIIHADDAGAVTSCFTAAYGRSVVRSGSYLRASGGVRHFSPREILCLLGFPDSFVLPAGLPPREVWRLVGNSLSVPAVRWVLSCIRELS
jgi:site-specific DNA-cytosine methylase